MDNLPARGVALIAVAGLLTWTLLEGRRETGPLVVSGLLECQEVRVGSRIGGRVAKVHASEGQAVEAGALLVSLEPHDMEERLAQARAQLQALESEQARIEAGARPEELEQARAVRDEAQALLDELKAGARTQELAAARAAVELAESELELATLEKERSARLVASGTASTDVRDVAITRWKAAVARRDTRKAELELLAEGPRQERIAAAEARVAGAAAALALLEAGARKEDRLAAAHRVEAARAQVAALERAREELDVRAPLESVVSALDLVPGDLVSPNAPVMAPATRRASGSGPTCRRPTSTWSARGRP